MKITIIIIAVVLCCLSVSSVGIYFGMGSPNEEKDKKEAKKEEAKKEAKKEEPKKEEPKKEEPKREEAKKEEAKKEEAKKEEAKKEDENNLANPGEAISCKEYNPKGPGAIYRYDGDKKMRWYPNPEIAGSWDSNWLSGVNRQLDCTGFVLGDDIQMNQQLCKFDARKYAEMYPDLLAAFGNDDAALKNHYITYGYNEGRSPCGITNCGFEYNEYLTNNPDVKNAGNTTSEQAWAHFKDFGLNENRLIRKC